MNLDTTEKIYFIGIGGIAMSATAGIAKEKGFMVSGSDSAHMYSPSKDVLDNYKIQYSVGYAAEHIKNAQPDIVIISAGETIVNPEVAYAIDNDIPYFSFCELLNELSKDQLRIVVCGTHGKSTTSGLLGHMLKNIDDSSFMVGAVLQDYATNFHYGQGHYFVFEGDEYKATFDDPTPKFHYYKPDIVVLNNLEFDHPDMFQDLEEIKREFSHLIDNMTADGIIIYNADDPNLHDLVYSHNVRSFGFSLHDKAEMQVTDIQYMADRTEFKVLNTINKDKYIKEGYSILLPGEMNVRNAMTAVTTLRAIGFEPELIQIFLAGYHGVKRRFEYMGEKNGIIVIDDYAHHPTAIRETLESARTLYADKKIWAVYEPHTFSRAEATLKQLETSFNTANEVLIAPIYAARENVSYAHINSEQLVAAIKKEQPYVRKVEDKQDAMRVLKEEAKAGDIIIIMAVGSFNKLARELVNIL